MLPDDHQGLEQDLDVQPQGPAADVVVIPLDPAFHLVDRFGLAATSVDLCQSGDPGL